MLLSLSYWFVLPKADLSTGCLVGWVCCIVVFVFIVRGFHYITTEISHPVDTEQAGQCCYHEPIYLGAYRPMFCLIRVLCKQRGEDC